MVILLRSLLVCTLIGHVVTGSIIGAGAGVTLMGFVGMFEPISVTEAIGTTLTCVVICTGIGLWSGWNVVRDEWK